MNYTYRANEDLALSTILLVTLAGWYSIIRWVLVPVSVLIFGEW